MFSRALTILILFTALELGVIILIGQQIGVISTLLLIFGTAILGLYLARIAGWQYLSSLREAWKRYDVPTDAALDGLMIVFGGFLFLLPGFVTDVIGLLMIVPLTRPWMRSLFLSHFKKRKKTHATVIEIHQIGDNR